MATPSDELLSFISRHAPPTGPPGVPDAPKRERATCTTVTIRFGGRLRDATDFKVQYGASGIAAALSGWTAVEGVVRAPVYTIVGLTPNTSYVFRVAAVNEHGESEFGAASEPITTLESSDVPAPPTPPQPVCVKATAHTLTVRYGHPAGSNPREVHPSTTYVLQAAPASVFSAWEAVNGGVPMVAGQHVLRGLPHGTAFTFRAKATNEGGESEFCEATKAGEGGFATLAVPVPAAPAAPRFKNTTTSGVIEVVVGGASPPTAAEGASGGAGGTDAADGKLPEDAAAITYVLEYSVNSMLSRWTSVDGGEAKAAGAVAVSGLDAGTEYLFRCFARSEGGDSAYSASSSSIKCGSGPVEAEEKGAES
mmetsp:Transcript_82084/g.199003  ORF Transcript_82084/g.199003 Transcript_82084/m.199003 type:complete len:366 (-) Transcript_82084:63-1160(-)